VEKMSLAAIVIGYLISFADPVSSQEVGGEAEYQRLRNMQRLETNREQSLNSSRKLFLDKKFAVAHDQSDCLQNWTVNSIGYVDYWSTEVLQVIDEQNMLVKIAKKVVWLEDFPTAGAFNSEKVRLFGPVKFIGTSTYDSAVGATNTVLTVRFLPIDDAVKFNASYDAEQEAKADKEKYKEWTTRHNKTIEAFVVSADDKTVTFELRDGTQKRLSMGAFSPSVQYFLKKEVQPAPVVELGF
jgi:hypothetical protein